MSFQVKKTSVSRLSDLTRSTVHRDEAPRFHGDTIPLSSDARPAAAAPDWLGPADRSAPCGPGAQPPAAEPRHVPGRPGSVAARECFTLFIKYYLMQILRVGFNQGQKKKVVKNSQSAVVTSSLM